MAGDERNRGTVALQNRTVPFKIGTVHENPDTPARAAEDEGPFDTGGKPATFWDKSRSGYHLVSRPIVVDGLRENKVRIELAPRIKMVDGQLVDDSYHAVEHAAVQLIHSFTLEQLVMATVALQVHMRKSKEHIEKKKSLQEKWTDLARRMKKLRVLDEHLSADESRLSEQKTEAADASDPNPSVEDLLSEQASDLSSRRAAWREVKAKAEADWVALSEEDEALLRTAPPDVETRDLQQPYVLTLLSPKADPGFRPRRRSLASAMNTLVDALQRPLSRTDQMLLEIGLRRCVRACAPDKDEQVAERWEKGMIREAEREFATEYPWAANYLSKKVDAATGR